MSLYQNAGQNHNIKIANRSFENMAKFQYLGMTINQNLIPEEIMSILNLGNVLLLFSSESFVISSAV
jgi:hypothetical protein